MIADYHKMISIATKRVCVKWPKVGRLGRVGAKWGGDGTLEIGLLNGNVGKRWDLIGIWP